MWEPARQQILVSHLALRRDASGETSLRFCDGDLPRGGPDAGDEHVGAFARLMMGRWGLSGALKHDLPAGNLFPDFAISAASRSAEAETAQRPDLACDLGGRSDVLIRSRPWQIHPASPALVIF
jgi:hypothetical protein